LVAKDREKGLAYAIAPIWHLRPYMNRASPLPMAAFNWNDAELAEWLAWEWAAKRQGGRDPKPAAVSYAAYWLAAAVVTRMQGPGSLQLARWREGVRDRRTFQLLASDLQGQVRGILASHTDPKDREATLRRIERNWLFSYQQQYSRRFLTNAYQGFGKDGWVDPLALEQIEGDTLGWGALEKLLPEGQGDAEALLRILK
ncbi:MAG TPA: hypothetical protein VFL04_01890, partial [Rectinemataceae bacterium]|nr:hypothetical protein [Rectinemataceae bacterium]